MHEAHGTTGTVAVVPGAWSALDLEPLGDGRYRATIGPAWMLAMVPQGGIVAAIATRAMALELHTEEGEPQALRSSHGVFVSPVPEGEVLVEVTVLRRGRSMSQAQATVRAPDTAAGYTALAVFGGPRRGVDFTELAFPEVPAPDACPSFRDGPPPEVVAAGRPVIRFPFWEEVVEGRSAIGHAPWDPTPRTEARCANWLRLDEPPVRSDGMLDPGALLAVADRMPGSFFERIGPTEEIWFAPSVDLTVHLFAPATPGWLLADDRAHHAGDGYASVETALWDPRGPAGPTLVAWATQVMFLTRMA